MSKYIVATLYGGEIFETKEAAFSRLGDFDFEYRGVYLTQRIYNNTPPTRLIVTGIRVYGDMFNDNHDQLRCIAKAVANGDNLSGLTLVSKNRITKIKKLLTQIKKKLF